MDIKERIPCLEWRNSQLSIARHSGGININGHKYTIERGTGDLVLNSVFKRMERERLKGLKRKKEEAKNRQGKLF